MAYNNGDYRDNTPIQIEHIIPKTTYLNRTEFLIYRYDGIK